MNVIDAHLEELDMKHMRAWFADNRFQVFIERDGGKHEIEGEGATFESAIRDALENARIGNTARYTPRTGERIYSVVITQTYGQVINERTSKRIIALNAAIADQMAQRAYSDRPGVIGIEASFCGTT